MLDAYHGRRSRLDDLAIEIIKKINIGFGQQGGRLANSQSLCKLAVLKCKLRTDCTGLDLYSKNIAGFVRQYRQRRN